MQTRLDPQFQKTADGKLAEDILRKCVHCGFCNATCPTYELLGDELDGPRGRIYQIKQLLEDGQADPEIRLHLDRCLICRSCETTCPSGVQYSKLLEIGKSVLDEKLPRGPAGQVPRRLIRELITHPGLFSPLLRVGQFFRKVLPASMADKVPGRQVPSALEWPADRHPRRMVVLAGCAQPSMTPNTNLAAANVLDRLGISLVEIKQAGCCGAVHLHTCGEAQGKAAARALIDNWIPCLDQGVEALVMTASGCGVTVKDYPHLFRDEPAYREKAQRISEKTRDLCEILEHELPADYRPERAFKRVAFHPPCTLQHGQQINYKVETLLKRAGYTLCDVADSHLCCGSAGTYSIFQSVISAQLRDNKQAALTANLPEVICTANVGCQTHLEVGSPVPVMHWIELLI